MACLPTINLRGSSKSSTLHPKATLTLTPNAKFPIKGDRMYPSPYNPPANDRHVGRQAPSGYDYNKPYPSSDDNTMNFAIVRNFPPDPNFIHSY